MSDTRTQAERIAILRAAIARSGLSNSKYAETILARDARTVRRWLAGDRPLPDAVLKWLAIHT